MRINLTGTVLILFYWLCLCTRTLPSPRNSPPFVAGFSFVPRLHTWRIWATERFAQEPPRHAPPQRRGFKLNLEIIPENGYRSEIRLTTAKHVISIWTFKIALPTSRFSFQGKRGTRQVTCESWLAYSCQACCASSHLPRVADKTAHRADLANITSQRSTKPRKSSFCHNKNISFAPN